MTETPNIEPACRAIARALAPEQYAPVRASQLAAQPARAQAQQFAPIPLVRELPASAIEARVTLARDAELARALAAQRVADNPAIRMPILCHVSGMLIGHLAPEAQCQIGAIRDPAVRARIQQDLTIGVHPAMVASDPESIRVQIREWPEASCVRMAGMLGIIEHDVAAIDRAHRAIIRAGLLSDLSAQDPHDIAVLAELLRIACGLFGRAARRGAYMGGLARIDAIDPPILMPLNLPATIAALRGWLADLIRQIQAVRHRGIAERQRQISAADLAAIAVECGEPAYRAARSRPNRDRTEADLAELSTLLGAQGIEQFQLVARPVAPATATPTPSSAGAFRLRIKPATPATPAVR